MEDRVVKTVVEERRVNGQGGDREESRVERRGG